MEIIEEIKHYLNQYNISYKENYKNLIILCPKCLLDGKYKLKLYIDKDNLIYHCFRCELKGSPYSLIDNAFKYFSNFDQYSGFYNDVKKRLESKIKLSSIGIKSSKKLIIPPKEYIDQIKNFKIPLKYLKRPGKYTYKYLKSRKINNFDNLLFPIKNQELSLKIKLDNSIIFPSFFRSIYQVRFPFSKFTYTINLFNVRFFNKLHNQLDEIIYIPDFFMIDTNRSTRQNKTCIVLEGEFDVLSAREILNNTGNYLLISSMGKSKFYLTLLFIEILIKYYSYNISNILFVYDNDVRTIQNKNKLLYKKKEIENKYKTKLNMYIMNTYQFVNNILNIKTNYEYKDLNEFLTKLN